MVINYKIETKMAANTRTVDGETVKDRKEKSNEYKTQGVTVRPANPYGSAAEQGPAAVAEDLLGEHRLGNNVMI